MTIQTNIAVMVSDPAIGLIRQQRILNLLLLLNMDTDKIILKLNMKNFNNDLERAPTLTCHKILLTTWSKLRELPKVFVSLSGGGIAM